MTEKIYMLIAEFKSVGDWEYCLMLVDAAAWKRKRVNDVLVEIDWEKGRKWTVHNGGGGGIYAVALAGADVQILSTCDYIIWMAWNQREIFANIS